MCVCVCSGNYAVRVRRSRACVCVCLCMHDSNRIMCRGPLCVHAGFSVNEIIPNAIPHAMCYQY